MLTRGLRDIHLSVSIFHLHYAVSIILVWDSLYYGHPSLLSLSLQEERLEYAFAEVSLRNDNLHVLPQLTTMGCNTPGFDSIYKSVAAGLETRRRFSSVLFSL